VRELFGVSRDALLVGVVGVVLLIVLVLVAAGRRNPLLPRLALRNAPRRPGFAALITLGLTLGTVILSTAFTTGDTMSLSVRSVVAGALGTADEVVFVPSGSQRTGFELAQAIASGNLLTGATSYFPVSDVERVRRVLAGDQRVAGVVPGILDAAPVENATGEGFRAQMNLIGVPTDAPASIATLRALDDDRPLSLADLGPGEAYVNAEAASGLGVGAGDDVRVFGFGDPVVLHVRAVAHIGDLGGAQAALFLPLDRLQRLVGHDDQINQVLIANRGSAAERLAASWPITVALRSAFADQRVVEPAFRALAQPGPRELIQSAATRVRGPGAEKVRLFVRELDAAAPTPAFAALVQDPEVLFGISFSLPGGGGRGSARGPLAAAAAAGGFHVMDVQRLAQDQANLWGSAFTDLFVVAGSFSLASGVLLIVLVFSLVALERRGELGVMRALGGRRSDVILLMAMEGAIYSAVSALFGLALGVAMALAIVALAGNLVAEYGFRLEPSVEPASLVLSFLLGVILTFATVTLTAWRSSRFSIVTAIRDVPDPPPGPPRLRGLVASGAAALVGVLLAGLGLGRGLSLVYAVGVTLVVVGGALVARWLLLRLGRRGPERLVFSLAGLALVAWWGAPVAWLRALHLPVYPRTPDMSFLAGLGLLLGAVWVIAYNVGLLRLAGRSGGLLWRLSVAYTAANRFRTGLTLAMFGLVVLSLTLASVLLTATSQAFGDPVASTGGWDVRAESPQPPRDLGAELQGGGLAPGAFAAMGGAGSVPVQALQMGVDGLSVWQSATVQEVDEAFTGGTTQPLTAWARADQRATWSELSARPGTAIVGAGLLRASPPSLRVVAEAGSRFRPVVLWVRDTRSSQPAVRLEVIGLADARGPFGSAVIVGAPTLSAWPPPERTSYFFAVPPGGNPRELAAAINLAVPSLQAQPIGEQLRLVQGVRGLLTVILQGFMGVGMVAGVAALGTISMRAVVERRRQIGVLRSLGVAARGVGLGLLTEAALVAALGIGIGLAVGLEVARGTVELLTARTPELQFAVPWGQLGLIAAAALAAALLMTALPSAQAARLTPAEALRDADS
jgi:putative ABC transport system permease protein